VIDPQLAAVLEANAAFYRAHEERDLAAMTAVWERSDRAACIHPGWPILRGWSLVEESWRRIFSGPGRIQFITTNESVMIEGDLAWVTLDENIVDGAPGGEGLGGTVAATNVFVRSSYETEHESPGAATRWSLVLHHGSPVAGQIVREPGR
jgi:ketosteroid isomerase-like protein